MKHPPSTRLASLALVALLCHASTSVAADSKSLPPLSAVKGSPPLPGKFVWADLVTHDISAAAKFYSELFGWTFRDFGGYWVAQNDERPLAGLMQRPKPTDASARPRWFGYVSVSSVSKAEDAVRKAGGKVLAPPQKFPKRGEQAVFLDPEGAMFGVVKSSSGDPEDFLASPGDWIWAQLLSRDGRKAAEFYRTIGGYEIVENTTPGALSEFVLTSKGYARATVRTLPAGMDQVKPNWLPFVRVKSIGDSLALAKKLGGSVLLEPTAELLQGKVAVIADPTGAAIGVLEWSESLMKGTR
jgi:predicted enzyme related to lactoylglutathione lyase